MVKRYVRAGCNELRRVADLESLMVIDVIAVKNQKMKS